MQFDLAVVSGPVAQVLADERSELDRLQVRPPGFALGACEEKERLDDPPEPNGLLVDVAQGSSVFLGRAVASQRNLDLAEQAGQRRPELVRGVAREPLLPLDLLVQSIQQSVERAREEVELAPGPWDRQAMVAVGRGHGAGGIGHPRHGEQRRGGPGTSPSPRRATR